MTSVSDSWDRIEHWLQHHAPDAYRALRPGATDAALARAEEALGVRLPDAYRESLRRHDGQDPNGPWLVDGGQLCSFGALLDEWRAWNKMLTRGELEEFVWDIATDDAVRGDQWWRAGWLPLVAQDGDHLLVDVDPDPRGDVGQVVAFSHETGPGHVAAPSYDAWLNTWADELEAGMFVLDPEDGGALRADEDGPSPRTWPRDVPGPERMQAVLRPSEMVQGQQHVLVVLWTANGALLRGTSKDFTQLDAAAFAGASDSSRDPSELIPQLIADVPTAGWPSFELLAEPDWLGRTVYVYGVRPETFVGPVPPPGFIEITPRDVKQQGLGDVIDGFTLLTLLLLAAQKSMPRSV